MYLKLLNSVRKIWVRFRKRVVGLLLYLHEYKVVTFCLTYVILQPITVAILRNINEPLTIGLVVLLLFFLFLLLCSKLIKRKREVIFEKSKRVVIPKKRYTQDFTLLVFALCITLFQIVRVYSTITTERKISELTNCFTRGSTEIEGYVTEEPTQKYANQQVVVTTLQGGTGCEQNFTKEKIKLILKVGKFHNIHIGQVCKFRGQLSEPKDFEDFSYKKYLRNKKIYFMMDFPEIECGSDRKGNRVSNILTNWRVYLEQKIDSVLNEPQSSLLSGILFGSKRLLEKEFEAGVRIAGVSHVVSASGYNITVLTVSLSKITSFLSKKKRIVLSLIVVWLFSLFSGFSASIVRACIMSSISLVALLLGRSNTIHIALPMTAMIFLIIEPLTIFDVGFQLSLSAMVGLIYIQPILKRVLPATKFIEESVLPTMSCTISTLPISIFTFKTVSIWSILANILILPVIGSTMLFGIVALMSSSFLSQLSYFFFTVVNLQLKYFEFVVRKIYEVRFGAFNIEDSYLLTILIIFLVVLLITVIYFYPIKNERYNYYLRDC